MGHLLDLVTELGQDLLGGDERARELLIALDAYPALWCINETFDALADYVFDDMSIVPQLPGEKKPCIRWKAYQEQRPSVGEIFEWFRRWPNAGPAIVLGPVSGLFVIDVDGREAHDELVRRLGEIPEAPTVLSGSGKPWRFHLYFRSPDVQTNAKATPWHPQLEFRGQGGIVVAPPSVHRSGNRYQWAPGKSLADLTLPPLPDAVIAALQSSNSPRILPPQNADHHAALIRVVPGVSRSTRQFLNGHYANGPDWNGRLFRAACDLAGNGIAVAQAIPQLLAGARPWNALEEARAITTIESAFASERMPARHFGR